MAGRDVHGLHDGDLQRIIAPIAEQYGLWAVYVFGSYARGEANADSDIDLLVDLIGTSIRLLLALGNVYCDLESALGEKYRSYSCKLIGANQQGCV